MQSLYDIYGNYIFSSTKLNCLSELGIGLKKEVFLLLCISVTVCTLVLLSPKLHKVIGGGFSEVSGYEYILSESSVHDC